MNRNIEKEISNGIIHSYSAILFSQSHIYGFVLLLLSMLNPCAGIYGLISCISVNLLAKCLHLDTFKIQSGYYGFNAVLTGIAIGSLFSFNTFSLFVLFASTLLIIQLCVMAEGIFQKYLLPYLSIPFLITLWGVMLSSQQTDDPTGFGLTMAQNTPYNNVIITEINEFLQVHAPSVINEYLQSLSFVFFQYSLFTGLIVAIGLILFSRVAFIFTAINFSIAHLLFSIINGYIFNLPFYYFGFNFIFTSIAVGCYYVVPSFKSLFWTLMLIPMQYLFIFASSRLLTYFYLPTYTFAFCTTSILYLYLLKRQSNHLNPEIALYLEDTPEKLIYNTSVNNRRLAFCQYIPIGLPFLGVWKVTQGTNGKYTHQKEWKDAWDFAITDTEGKEYKESGYKLEDYYSYASPVVAPADGIVEYYENSVEDNEPGEDNDSKNWGNYIIIKHATGLYSAICHLKKGSIRCTIGQHLLKGEPIALCGNSGHSPYPHIHYQMQASPIIGAATISYPISDYICQSKNNAEFKLCDKPSENDQICSITYDFNLHHTYNLASFKSMKVSSPIGNDIWEQKTDLYGLNYIEDEKANKAWFVNNGSLFYFIRYEGKRNSNLYFFFLSNYMVLFNTDSHWNIHDELSLSNIRYDFKKLIQDIIAYLYIGYKYCYTMDYDNNHANNDNQIILNSKIESSFFGNKKCVFTFKTTILDKNLYAIHTFEANGKSWLMKIEGTRY